MGGKLLRDQTWLDLQSPMPVDDLSMSSSVQAAPAETVALYYDNAGTRTLDAGQLAGVAVQGRLTFKNILNVSGGALATFNDTSLAFTGDLFDDEVPFPTSAWEKNKDATWADKLAAMTAGMSNGQYTFNYRTGAFWGIKTTATVSLTSVTYDINQGQTGASGGLTTEIAGYDEGTNGINTNQNDPDWAHNTFYPGFVLTNVPNATPDETIIIDMEDYTGISFHVEQTGGSDTFTATFEASDEGTASTDDFIDITTNGMTVASAGGLTADFVAHTNAAFRGKAIKLKITTAGTADDADFTVFAYRF